MKVTVIGCWSPYPRAGGACPGYLIESEATRILLDCGNGTLGKLMQICGFRSLTAVVVTHYHPDHYYDLFSLRHAIWGSQKDGSRKEPLPVYLPSEPQQQYEALTKFEGIFKLHRIETLPQVPKVAGNLSFSVYQAKIGSLDLEFCLTSHPMPTYAVSFGEEDKKLVYSSDTAYNEEIVAFAQNAGLFLCEASLQEKDIEHTKVGHLTARQAGEIGAKAGVKNLLLTHFWPEYDLRITAEEASASFGHPVETAVEGKSYPVN